MLKVISELKGAPKTPGLAGNVQELWAGFKRNTFLHVLLTIFLALTTAYVLFGTLFQIGVDDRVSTNSTYSVFTYNSRR